EQIGRNAARVVPVFAKTEKAIAIILSLWRIAEPHLPVDKVFALAFGAGRGIDLPIPFALRRVAMIRALAHYQPPDHSVLNRLASLPPLIGACSLGANLKHTAARDHFFVNALCFLDGMSHRLFEIDILPLVHRFDGNAPVPMIGSSY